MRTVKISFLFIFLLFISAFPFRLGVINQTGAEIILVFFSLSGIAAFGLYLAASRYKINNVDIFLLFFLLIYPFISSFTAMVTAGQPLYMGLLTFRHFFILFSFYTFYVFGLNKEIILDTVSVVVILIITVSSVLFFFFGVNDSSGLYIKGSVSFKYGVTTTKGLQFTGFHCLFFIPYIVGWVRFFEKNKHKSLIIPVIILLFTVFVTKARNEILAYTVMPLIMYFIKYKKYNTRLLVYSFLLFAGFLIVILTNNVISRNFSGLLKPGDLEYAQATGDYSAYLRFEQIKIAWEWIFKHPLLGTGSLSYRYNDGFLGLIADFFYISDLGWIGILVEGGLVLLLVYIALYVMLYNYFISDNLYSVTGRYLTIFLILEIILFNDFFGSFPGVFVIIFLLTKDIKRTNGDLYS